MEEKKKHSIGFRIAVGTVCGAVVLGLGFYAYQAWQYRNRFLKEP